MNSTDFQEIEKSSVYPYSSYEIDIPLDSLEECLERYIREYDLDLNPDFQRAHVWTPAQQEAFVLYLLQGGPSARVLYLACEGWKGLAPKQMIIVDGKQRLEAVRSFLRNELPVNGKVMRDWTGRLRMHRGFKINIADLDRASTLRWYIALNTGGTMHTDSEIERVKALLEQANG